MKSQYGIFVAALILCLTTGCAKKQTDNLPCENIEYFSYKERDYSDFMSKNKNDIQYVVLNSTDKNYLFSEIDKIVVKSNRIYVLDWISRKILAFDEVGTPILSINKRGRGPGEYLQITDFDVDDNGNIWIIDGQRDVLLNYDVAGKFISSQKLPWEINAIKCMPDSRFLLNLAPWDNSRYAGEKVLFTDNRLKVIDAMLEYEKNRDENYAFPSPVFNDCDTMMLYHIPIDDYVYSLSATGEIYKKYYFDFGNRSIPVEYRKEVERYRDDIRAYTTLVKSLYIDEHFIVGSVLEEKINDFIIDKKSNVKYLHGQRDTAFYLIGISDKKIIWRVSAEMENFPDYFPENIVDCLKSGEEVLLLLPLLHGNSVHKQNETT